jgi:hypothetical protein
MYVNPIINLNEFRAAASVLGWFIFSIRFVTLLNVLLHLSRYTPGLPDGFFSDQKSQFDHILEDLRKEKFLAIWNIFTTIVYTFYGHLVNL